MFFLVKDRGGHEEAGQRHVGRTACLSGDTGTESASLPAKQHMLWTCVFMGQGAKFRMDDSSLVMYCCSVRLLTLTTALLH